MLEKVKAAIYEPLAKKLGDVETKFELWNKERQKDGERWKLQFENIQQALLEESKRATDVGCAMYKLLENFKVLEQTKEKQHQEESSSFQTLEKPKGKETKEESSHPNACSPNVASSAEHVHDTVVVIHSDMPQNTNGSTTSSCPSYSCSRSQETVVTPHVQDRMEDHISIAEDTSSIGPLVVFVFLCSFFVCIGNL